MANVFVYSGAGGAGTGADWTNAYTTLAAALTAKAAGDVFYVAHNHAESLAGAITLTSPGTSASPCQIICVTNASTPASADITTGATITTTGANSITTAGIVSLCHGITFTCADGANNGSWLCGGDTWRFTSCSIRLGNTSASALMRLQNSNERSIYENCTFQFGSVSQSISYTGGANLIIKGGSFTGATFPNVLFGTTCVGTCNFEGTDLNALSGKTLVNFQTGARAVMILKDCKLPASFTLTTGTAIANGTEVILLRTDSGDTNYRVERHTFEGSQIIETTIVRSGGASDGTTPISWKIAATAAKWTLPYTSLPIQIWNETTGSRTITVYGVWGGGAVPNNDEIWLEIEYLGTSGFPLGLFTNTTKADFLASATATNSDTSTWASAPGTDFTMTKTITINEKGPITIWIKAVGTGPYYIDPKATLT